MTSEEDGELALLTAGADDDSSHRVDVEVEFDVGILTEDELKERGMSEFVLDEEFVEEFKKQGEIQEQLQSGKSLRDFSEEIEGQLFGLENDLIDDIVQKADLFVDLNRELKECEDVFLHFEHILSRFQKKFTKLTDTISTFQDRSHVLSFQLDNCRAAQNRLELVQEDFGEPSRVLESLQSGPVNVAHLLMIEQQEERLKEPRNTEWANTSLFQGIQTELTILTRLAIRKIVGLFMHQFGRLSEMVSSSGHQSRWEERQTPLLKYAYFNSFLSTHDRGALRSIKTAYVAQAERYYTALFSRYTRRMLRTVRKPKVEVLVEKKKKRLGFFASLRRRKPQRQQQQQQQHQHQHQHQQGGGSEVGGENQGWFALGERSRVLIPDEYPGTGGGGQSGGATSSSGVLFEVVFKSINALLLRSCVSEHAFLKNFFFSGVNTADSGDAIDQEVKRMGSTIFGGCFKIILDAVQKSVRGSKDVVGMYLLIKVAEMFKQMGCLFLEDYLADLPIILWPLFKRLIDENVTSVKTAFANHPINVLVEAERNHTVTRRYSALISSILQLSSPEDIRILTQNLNILRSSIRNFLETISRTQRYFETPKEKLLFLINSYDVVTRELGERQLTNSEEFQWYTGEMISKVEAFRGIIVEESFPRLVEVVSRTKPLVSRTAPPGDNLSRVNAAEMEQLASDFRKSWSSCLDGIRDEVESSFRNFETGRDVLRQIFDYLQKCYDDFRFIVRCCYGMKGCPFDAQMVGAQIMSHTFHRLLSGGRE